MITAAALLFIALSTPVPAPPEDPAHQEDRWVVYEGGEGAGAGKHLVFVSGDEEYRSEEALPMLAQILARRHGFRCTVLFSQDPETGVIDPNNQTHIPGLSAVDSADVLILFLRFRELPDGDMKHIVDHVESGGSVIGIRTATHAFAYKRNPESPYAHYSWRDTKWKGGFGRQVLGETWVSHHGGHGSQSTRGLIVAEHADHPILRGVTDIWGPTDVYGVRELPAGTRVLVRGQVLAGMKPTDAPVEGRQNDPMMPLIWIRDYEGAAGKSSRVLCSTIGASVDFESAGLRRLMVNACYWGAGLEESVPALADVEYLRPYEPTFFGFGKFRKDVKPRDLLEGRDRPVEARRIEVEGVGIDLPLLFAAAGDLTTPEDWPQWRGPNHDGSVEASDLPTEFSKTEGVRWAVDLPGSGAGTPAILGERVFVSSIDDAAGSFVAICLDRESGEERWRRKPDSGYRPAGNGGDTWLHDRSNYASPSPVTDGERAVFFFGNGDLVAYDMEGEKLWIRNLQKDFGQFTFQWTFSSSPTLWEDTLFMQILQRDTKVYGHGNDGNPSFLLAMDPDTGETRFKHIRPSDARKESLESYATPTPYVGTGGRKELLVVGGDVVTGHDPKTGDELWRWGTWNTDHREEWWRLVPSVVVGGGHALICAPKRAPVFAVRLGGEGDLGEKGLAWKSGGRRNPLSSDVPTPLFYMERFFVLSDVAKALSRVDPATGEAEWTIELPGRDRWRSSPTGADGHIWFMDHAGDVLIVDPADGSIVNHIPMGEEDADKIRSSIAVAHDHLFIRTNTRLFCVGG